MSKKNSKQILFERMHKVAGMPLKENFYNDDQDDASRVGYDNAMSDFPTPKYSIFGSGPDIDWNNVNDEYKPIMEWAIHHLMSMDETDIANMLKKYSQHGLGSSLHNYISKHRNELIKYFMETISNDDLLKLKKIYDIGDREELKNLYLKYIYSYVEAKGEHSFSEDL